MLSRGAHRFIKNFAGRTQCLYYASKASKKAMTKENKTPLVTCKNSKLNLYLEDLRNGLGNSEELTLASKGWQHYKAKGDYFIIHQTKNASDILNNAREFKSLGLDETLVKNLDQKHDIIRATKLQQEAMKEILDNQHVLIGELSKIT